MKKVKILSLALALVLALSFAFAAVAEESSAAVDFTVTDAEGNKFSLSQNLVGKPVIINFWASWCPPCVAELPHFDAAAKQYDGQIIFMMVNLTDGQYETLEGAKAFIKENGYEFPVYFDTEGDGSSVYVGQYIPITWFIKADGNILGYVEGGMSEETLLDCIGMLLGDE